MFSESILAANIAALVRTQGHPPALDSLDPERMRVVPDGAGLRLELRTQDGAWIRLDEPTAPEPQPQVFVIGIALGTILDEMERTGALTRVIALEPEPGVATLMLARRDWTRWFESGRLRLLTGPDYRGAASCSRHVSAIVAPRVIEHPTLAAHRPAEVGAARTVVRQMIADAEKNFDARRRFAGRYLLQTLANLPVIAREADAGALDGLFAGLPAVVVGAGPSLDKNLPALAALQDRAVVVGADTALRPLIKGGVRPHLMVAVDPGEINARHLAGVEGIGDVHLVAEGSLNPIAFEGFAGRTFNFKVSNHEPWPWLETRGLARTTLRAWGSVITSAFDLALRLGCNPIVFAGLDLAYTGMRPYCHGTIYDAQWQEGLDAGYTMAQTMAHYFSQQPDVRMPDLNGEEVRTTPAMVAFRNWLLEQSAGATDRTVVNATGGGILYGKGVRQSTLHEALATTTSLGASVRERITAAYRTAASPVSLRPDVDRLLQAATRKALPLFKGWREFTLNTVSDDQIAAALKRSRAPRRYHRGPGGSVATLVTVHVTHAGGGALLAALRHYYGEADVLIAHDRIDVSWTRGDTRPALIPASASAPDLRGKAVIHGHFHGGKYREIDALRITLLRHPVDRLLSHYYFERSQPDGPIGGLIARERLSVLDFATLPAMRHLYTEVFFTNVDMRSFDVIVGPHTYDADIARIAALLGTRLDVPQEHKPVSANDPRLARETETRRQLADILADDIRFYEDVIASRR
jgi:hypothetical protein